MATIYFTSNADSGDGTLRAAIESATDGDVITYDPAVFTSGPVVISLSTYLPIFPNNATLDGGELGVVINGQNRTINGYSALRTLGTLTVINVTVTRYKVSTNSPIFINDATASHIYKRCKFVENEGVWYGVIYLSNGSLSMYDCLITGNVATGSATTSGGIAIANGRTVDFVRSTLCGNRKGNIGSASLTRLNNINSFVGLTPPEIDGVTPEEIGFINPPPSAAIPEADYTEGDWQSWDFRLKPTSAYLTGAAYNPGELDLLGHPRTGSWGCYDGSWLVAAAGASVSVASAQTVDWLDVAATGSLTLASQVVLTVQRGVTVTTGSAISASTGRAYLVAPALDAAAAATLSNVVVCVSGAGASNFAATTAGMTWNATDSSKPVLLELVSAGAYTTIAQTAGTSYTTTLASGATVRLFDGVTFLSATVPAPPGPSGDFDFHAFGIYGATITVSVGVPYLTTTQTASAYTVTQDFILMSDYYNAGEAPLLMARIQDSRTADIIQPASVSSISYTAYSASSGWGIQTRTPVDGHENVTVPSNALKAALVTDDPRWTVDSTGYNFIFEPDCTQDPIFPSAGEYVVVVTINFTNANPLPVVFNVSVN